MELYGTTERWDFTNGPEFLYSQIIFRSGTQFFWARSKHRGSKAPTDVEIDPRKIPPEHIFPLAEEVLFEASEFDDALYIKRPRLTGYDGNSLISSGLLQEVRVCEIIRQHPHPHIAKYHGCIVQNGRITGLAFDRYAETIAERFDRCGNISTECFQRIQDGIKHLHSLRLVHNDIGPDNIMFADIESKEPIIIDFDSCVLVGSPLPVKRGPVPEGTATAEFGNDFFGLEMMLIELQGGQAKRDAAE
ncbi:hypothetical protein S7711_10118 [Stachybotrys chartarum IBT 7711]|uniref:Protein kinase domain-containing protein n=1 Tax=Stachybotrys chartarum (strain CBS 109288 / IBT 7711) TaxID=1280523 RepID=A0A084AEZ4_STACB|nr:hypothetical protein S7711_10118 [Stachybotrys chartarum IBT 7711]